MKEGIMNHCYFFLTLVYSEEKKRVLIHNEKIQICIYNFENN